MSTHSYWIIFQRRNNRSQGTWWLKSTSSCQTNSILVLWGFNRKKNTVKITNYYNINVTFLSPLKALSHYLSAWGSDTGLGVITSVMGSPLKGPATKPPHHHQLGILSEKQWSTQTTKLLQATSRSARSRVCFCGKCHQLQEGSLKYQLLIKKKVCINT